MKRFVLTAAALVVMCGWALGRTEVVAHRGYWRADGSAQNSIASWLKADSIGVYGSEMDVWMTADDQLVVNHDRTFKGVDMVEATGAEATAVVLDNGENLPTLRQYLEAVASTPATRLVLELKSLPSLKREDEAAAKVADMLREFGLVGRTDIIAFSINACLAFCKIFGDEVPVYYLDGDLAPKKLKSLGLAGCDYHWKTLQAHPEWIDQAHELGLKVNVWTVDDPDVMQWFIDRGVDFITTNEPVTAQRLAAGL